MKFSPFEKNLSGRPGGVDNIYGNKGKSAADRAEEKYFGDSEGKLRHSKYYHDYFRGYTEVRTEHPENRFRPYKIQRIYTAPWIVVDMNPGAYFGCCCCYVLLALLCAILFVSALTDRTVASNYSPVVAVPGYLSVVALLLFVIYTVAYLLRPKRMTLYEHSSSTGRLKAASLATGILCGLTTLVSLGYLLFADAGGSVGRPLVSVAKLAGASVSALGVWALERKMSYTEKENNTVLPEGEAHRIQ